MIAMFHSLESLSHGVDTTPRLRGRKALRALLTTSTSRIGLEDIKDVYLIKFGLVHHDDSHRVANMSDKEFETSTINSIKQYSHRVVKFWSEVATKIQGKQIKKELANKEINEPQYVVSLHALPAGQTVLNTYMSELKQILAIPTTNNGTVIPFNEWIRKVTHICHSSISNKHMFIVDTSPYIKSNIRGFGMAWMDAFPFGYNGDGEFSGITFSKAGYMDPSAIKTAFNVVHSIINDNTIYSLIHDVFSQVSTLTKSQHTGIISMLTKDKIDPNSKKIAIALLSLLSMVCDTQYEIISYYEDDITGTILQAYSVEPYFESKELAEDYGWND